eukprot:CAMPEP_0195517798 /NCGR_PEP_ID=MMETSP0794_2-20130614/11702_1 /TAXON_ID=515487 /ORGANISM="Stephanopyxis turris, Strain CCMP 815" /LENGTH=257 /DNA_ID=CAMNT_0040646669 /DNA_START=25 /DNA_END=798 /DNA_ORIENTATION=+
MKATATALASLFAGAAAFAPAPKFQTTTALSESVSDLEALAKSANPIVKFYDPLQLSKRDFWEQGNEATIGFLRHAEIKHGRVAMAAFVGYCVQSNFHWPAPMCLDGTPFPSIDLGPESQWDAIPASAKWQIILYIGFLEIWDEIGGDDLPHYTKGRKPGKYPSFKKFSEYVHPVSDLYDPAGYNRNMSEETKERRLVAEINNGRLAQLGIFGFLCADTIPGSVPSLKDIAIPYSGETMAPFEKGMMFDFSNLHASL